MQLDLLAVLERGLAGHYTVTREIGRGGMAVVYECRDLIGNRDVAIKLLYPDLARAVGGERFLREIGILQQLSHPNILPLLDSGSIELLPGLSLPWYAMPLAREETLRARLGREGALPLATALGYARDLCAGLTHAHGQGVVHRDIKPENILLVDGHAVLADFGIARAITVAGGDALSTTGIVVGTPAYMSPEQSTGAHQLDGRSDLYSLGVVLYEMLAGHAPFTGSTPQAISARHQFETPPPITVVRPGLPDGVTVILERALAKVAADRYQQAPDLEGVLSTLPSRVASLKRPRRRPYTVLIGVGLGALILLSVVGWQTINTDLPSPVLAVPPFVAHVTGDGALCGSECSTLVDDALSQSADVPMVDQLRVRNAVSVLGRPIDPAAAERIARHVAAGRFVWGEVTTVGDSLQVHLTLFQLRKVGFRRLNRYTFTAGTTSSLNGSDSASTSRVLSAFRRAVRILFAPSPTAALRSDDPAVVTDLRAVHLKLVGDSALSTWDVRGAAQAYREALQFEPHFPQAHLMLALVGSWQRSPRDQWGAHAREAAANRRMLTAHQALLAEAYAAMSRDEYPEACRLFNQGIAADSSDFASWFGLGDCLLDDRIVIASSTSPSGWEFRGNAHRANLAYHRAFALASGIHQAFAGSAYRGLFERLLLDPWVFQFGRLEGNNGRSFFAFPRIVEDTISFAPDLVGIRSSILFTRGTWDTVLAHGRRSFLRLSRQWIQQFPASATAWSLHGMALELGIGLDTSQSASSAALRAFERAQRLATTSSDRLDLGAALVRVHLKLGQMERAIQLADSLLAGEPPSRPDEYELMAGLAAFRVDPSRAASLARAGAAVTRFPRFGSTILDVSESTKADAMALLVFAVFQGPKDSISQLHASIIAATGFDTPTEVQKTEREALLARPQVVAYPLLGEPMVYWPTRYVQRALLAGDTTGAREALNGARQARMKQGGVLPGPSWALLEAQVLLQLHDTTESRATLQDLYQNLRHQQLNLLRDIPDAASLGLGLRLLDSLNARAPAPLSFTN